MSTLSDEVMVVRAANPGWNFQTAWNHITKTQSWRFSKSVETNRLEAKLAPQKEEEAREKFTKVESIARRLMQRNSKLTFGAALEITRTCLPRVQAEMADLLRQPTTGKPKEEPAGRVEAGDDHPPHPGQAAAIAKGLLLIEGGFATPIIPHR